MNRFRRGFTLLEVSVAIVLLAGAMLAAAQVLALTVRQRATSDQRFAGELEASNVAEQISAMDYDAITPESAQAMKLSAAAQAALPTAELQVACTVHADAALPAKRIAIEIRWPAAEAERRAVRLVTFKHAPVGAQP